MLDGCAGMSAFGGKADMALRGSPPSRSLIGKSGHDVLHCVRLLLTQSGHIEPPHHETRWKRLN